MLAAMNASASALTAHRLHMDLIADNLANLDTTRTAAGGPYRRRVPVLAERSPDFVAALAGARAGNLVGDQAGGTATDGPGGVAVAAIATDNAPLPRRYDPGHPDAGADGWVETPNVNLTQEMVDLVVTSRVFDANVTAFNAAKSMALRTLELGRS